MQEYSQVEQLAEINHFMNFNLSNKRHQLLQNPVIKLLIERIQELDLTLEERNQLLDDLNSELIKPQINLNSETLDISDLGLTRIPNKIMTDPTYNDFWRKLKVLRCGSNLLKSLPDALSNCTALQDFDCAFNELQSLPNGLGSCTTLQKFDCCFNKLQSLPNTLGNCTKLQELSCHNNKLSSLPDSLGNCAELIALSCYMNNLSSLPNSLGKCAKLKGLWCQGNELGSIPNSLGNCSELEQISFLGNRLWSLPSFFTNKFGSRWHNETLKQQFTFYSNFLWARDHALTYVAGYLPSFMTEIAYVELPSKAHKRDAPETKDVPEADEDSGSEKKNKVPKLN